MAVDNFSTTRAFWQVTVRELNVPVGDYTDTKNLINFYNYQDAYIFMKGINAAITGKSGFTVVVHSSSQVFELKSNEFYVGDR